MATDHSYSDRRIALEVGGGALAGAASSIERGGKVANRRSGPCRSLVLASSCSYERSALEKLTPLRAKQGRRRSKFSQVHWTCSAAFRGPRLSIRQPRMRLAALDGERGAHRGQDHDARSPSIAGSSRCSPSSTSPIKAPAAGSRLIKVPKAWVGSRVSAIHLQGIGKGAGQDRHGDAQRQHVGPEQRQCRHGQARWERSRRPPPRCPGWSRAGQARPRLLAEDDVERPAQRPPPARTPRRVQSSARAPRWIGSSKRQARHRQRHPEKIHRPARMDQRHRPAARKIPAPPRCPAEWCAAPCRKGNSSSPARRRKPQAPPIGAAGIARARAAR